MDKEVNLILDCCLGLTDHAERRLAFGSQYKPVSLDGSQRGDVGGLAAAGSVRLSLRTRGARCPSEDIELA